MVCINVKKKYRAVVGGFLFALVLFTLLTLPVFVTAQSLELNPPVGSYVVGDTLSVDVLVDTAGQNINAVSGEVRYDASLLRAASVSHSNSIVDLWIEEPSIVGGNTVTFEGLIVNPGFTGTGRVIKINFSVLDTGSAAVSFASGLVLANDGFGTNVVEGLKGASFILIPSGDGTDPDSVLPPEDDLSLAENGEAVLPPAVISYTENVTNLNEFAIRGVTYPNAEVHVYLQSENEEMEMYRIVSDPGGNFVYRHEDDAGRSQLLTANVFSILDALAQPRTEETYQFWLTAVQDGTESESTQPFDVFVMSGSGVLLLFSFILLAAAILLVVYVARTKYKHDVKVMKEVRKDIDNLSYDIEKYEAKKRQDARPGGVDVQ